MPKFLHTTIRTLDPMNTVINGRAAINTDHIIAMIENEDKEDNVKLTHVVLRDGNDVASVDSFDDLVGRLVWLNEN